jgi:NAD-dependent SIR2 family protein deacetylase
VTWRRITIDQAGRSDAPKLARLREDLAAWLTGSTLIVEPAASLCAIAAEAGAALVIVNRDPTPYDTAAAAVIRDPIGTAVPRITDKLLAASRA